MLTEIGTIDALFRYPVKSMRGESLETATLGLHGIEGDRRFALRKAEDHSGFPWLTASKLPSLVRYAPIDSGSEPPTHVRSPEGEDLPVFSPELAAEIAGRYGSPVEMLHMRHGIFDDASLSVIALQTIAEISRLAGVASNVRRFRPNVALKLTNPEPFQEDRWHGGILFFGDGTDAPALSLTMHDIRCVVVNVDPDTAKLNSEVLKVIVRENQTKAGIYGTVMRTGKIAVGQKVFFRSTL
jgi:uncharacterized protein YcbX